MVKKIFSVFILSILITTIFPKGVYSAPNLIPNGGLENESPSGFPTSWKKGGYGQNTRTLSYPVTGSSGRGVEVTLSNYQSGDAKWYFDRVPVVPGTYKYSDEYKSTVPSFVTVEFLHKDGHLSYKDIAKPATASSFTILSATFTVPDTVASITIFHLIKSNGTMTIDNASLETVGGSVFDTGAVTIRLDDASISQYQNAFPKLNSSGIKATLYVISGRTSDLGYSGYMSKTQIQEESARGHEIGAHTRTHRDLRTLSSAEKQTEIKGSRDDLLLWNVGPVFTLSYPFGSYDAESIQITKNAGFKNAVSTNTGFVLPTSDRYQIERQSLENTTTFAQAKDWIDSAITNKEWLVITAHQVKGACPERYCIPTLIFGQIIDYLVSKNARIVTISEGANSLTP